MLSSYPFDAAPPLHSPLLSLLPRDAPLPPPSPPLRHQAVFPPVPAAAATAFPDTLRPPLPLSCCIDCESPPPIDPDSGAPAIISFSCRHLLCVPCYAAIVSAIDSNPSDVSLLQSFCHICHPLPLPPPSSEPTAAATAPQAPPLSTTTAAPILPAHLLAHTTASAAAAVLTASSALVTIAEPVTASPRDLVAPQHSTATPSTLQRFKRKHASSPPPSPPPCPPSSPMPPSRPSSTVSPPPAPPPLPPPANHLCAPSSSTSPAPDHSAATAAVAIDPNVLAPPHYSACNVSLDTWGDGATDHTDPSSSDAYPLDIPTEFDLSPSDLQNPNSLPPIHAADAVAASDAGSEDDDDSGAATAPPATPTATPSSTATAPSATPAPTVAYTVSNNPFPAVDGEPFRCLLLPCDCGPASFTSRGKLAEHYRKCHHPPSIPIAALAPYQLHPCPTCGRPYISPATLANHVKSAHGSPSAPAAAPNADSPPTASSATAAHPSTSTIDYLTPNRPFLSTVALDSLELHHVHSQAISAFPRAAIPCIDVVLLSFLRAATADLDDDVATLAIYALPRLLLAPPPKNLPRASLVDLHRRRTADLAAGHAAQLWRSHDWLASLPSAIDFPTTTPEQSAARLINTAPHRSPSSIFRSMTDPPYLPPTAHTQTLLLSLFPTAPNPDLDADRLPAEAANLLPSSPLGAATIANNVRRGEVVAAWRRHFRRNPPGAPDGTGFTSSLISACTDSFPLLALWLHALLHARTTPAHRLLLSSQSLGAKLKPDKTTGKLPSTASDATAGRPLARCPIFRRLIAGFLCKLLTPHRRTLYTNLRQFGLIRSGLEAAPRRHQLRLDLTDAPVALASLDISNAHTSVARIATYLVLAAEARRTGHVLDRLECLYFLSMYATANPTIIQVGHGLHLYHQTDALQQGEADASHAFGHTISRLISDHLLPAIPLAVTLVHDDTMFEAQTLALDAADPALAALFIAAIAAASTAASSKADATSAHHNATSAQTSAAASSTAASAARSASMSAAGAAFAAATAASSSGSADAIHAVNTAMSFAISHGTAALRPPFASNSRLRLLMVLSVLGC